MPKRSSKKKNDLNTLAKSIVDQALGENQDEMADIISEAQAEGKNPAAVMLGRIGGLKGGKARAAKLSARKRSEIAKKAAKARWHKHE
jgi:hypothetical protein